MNRKGASHVDWVISMGIFIIYVIALFVFLRPGINVENKPRSLLDILENGVKEEIYVNAKETPLYIDICEPYTTEEGTVDSIITVKDENSGWNFVKILDESRIEYLKCSFGGEVQFVCKYGDANNPNIEKKKFILIHLPKNKDSTAPKLNVECSNANKEYCDAELYATVNKYYVYEEWLDAKNWVGAKEGAGDTYTLVKKKFGFPEQKDFIISYIIDGKENIIAGSSEEKPEQENVYVIEWKDSYISSNSYEPELIVIHIEVW